MIPQITKALSSGFKPKQVIDFLLRKFPQHSDKIKSALAAGFTTEQILKFLEGGRKELNEPLTEHQQTRKTDVQREENVNKAALTGAGLAATTLMAPMVQTALQRALPSSLKEIAPALTEPFQQQTILPQSQQPPININPEINSTNIQPKQNIPQPEIKPINSIEILNKHKLKDQTDKLIASGNGAKEVSGYLTKFNPGIVKSIEKEVGQPLEKVINSYLEQKVQNIQEPQKIETQIQEKGTENVQMPNEKAEEIFQRQENPISKTEIVATPKGIGEVKEIRNGKALVSIDGKKHVINEDELEQESPDIAELYDNLFNAIPDQYKSRMMNYAGYDEDANELLFRPHGGAAYVYKNIPPEFADELKNRLHRAKTTGKNMYGMWNEGDQSFGAGMSKLIKELQAQYGGKGKEYIRKYNTLFDILGIPHEEKKRKEREEREERQRLKRNG